MSLWKIDPAPPRRLIYTQREALAVDEQLHRQFKQQDWVRNLTPEMNPSLMVFLESQVAHACANISNIANCGAFITPDDESPNNLSVGYLKANREIPMTSLAFPSPVLNLSVGELFYQSVRWILADAEGEDWVNTHLAIAV